MDKLRNTQAYKEQSSYNNINISTLEENVIKLVWDFPTTKNTTIYYIKYNIISEC